MNNTEVRNAESGMQNDEIRATENGTDSNTPRSAFRTPNLAGWTLRFLLAAAILSGTLQTTDAYAISGREVYEKVHEVRSKALDRKTEAVMVLFDKGGGKRTRWALCSETGRG